MRLPVTGSLGLMGEEKPTQVPRGRGQGSQEKTRSVREERGTCSEHSCGVRERRAGRAGSWKPLVTSAGTTPIEGLKREEKDHVATPWEVCLWVEA